MDPQATTTDEHRWSEPPRRKYKDKSLQNIVPLTTENE